MTAKRPPLSKRLEGLAQWLDAEGYEHNAKMVREAARLAKRNGK